MTSVHRDAGQKGRAPMAGGVNEPRSLNEAAAAAPPGPRAVARGHWWERRKVMSYLLIGPAVLCELLVHFVLMVAGVVMSFYSLTLFTLHHWASAPFAGLSNFRVALNFNGPIGSALVHSFDMTVPYTLLVVGISWVIGMLAATGLNVEFKGRSWLRSALLVPYAMPVYVAIIVWSFMLQRSSGVVKHILVHHTHESNSPPSGCSARTPFGRWWRPLCGAGSHLPF